MRVEPPLSIRNRKGCPAEGSILYTSHSLPLSSPPMDRRTFLQGAAAGAATLALSRNAHAEQTNANLDFTAIQKEIEKRHDESVQRLQQWIRQPSIAAEKLGMDEGCDLIMRMLRDAGFGEVTKVSTDGQPGISATLDAGAPRSIGMYFMYDVKQADPAEWSSPPFEAALVDKPGLGKCVVGRGAVNQKGPEASFLAALHAIRGAGRKLPVNLVLVAEGEEEIGSPHFPQIVRRPEVLAALRKCNGIYMPSAEQDLDGKVTMTLGAKGVIECELVSSGEKWGRGPRKDVHSSTKAMLDSPAWHLVEALVTLVSPDGNTPAIEGFAALKAHLAKHGFGDIEVNMTGGYDPNSTSADTPLIRAQVAFYRGKGVDPIILPRSAGSWPGYVFTGDPLHLAAGHFGMGHGSGAHAPDEYYVIESTNPNVQGIDGAVRSHVEYLYELAAIK